jgi:LysM repeat protein
MATRKPPAVGADEASTDAATITVQPGDSWAVIADRIGVDVQALVNANGSVAAQPLIVGDLLVRP